MFKALRRKNTIIIVDSIRDLQIIKQYLKVHRSKKCKLGIRLRFDLNQTSLSANHYSDPLNKLGNYADSEVYKEFLEYVKCEKRVKWDIIHTHFTINELSSQPYIEVMNFLHKHLLSIKQKYNLIPLRIDLGGGLEVYSKEYEKKIEKLFKAVSNRFSILFPRQTLIMEPGRFFSACAGYVVGKVVDIKQVKTKKWLITDIGTNVLIPNNNARYNLLYPQQDKKGVHIGITDGITSGVNNIVENVYISSSVQIGDTVIIGNVGAYTDVYSTFWGYEPFAVGYVYKSGKIKMVRKLQDIVFLKNIFFPHLFNE